MDSWVGLEFYLCYVHSIPKLKNVGLMSLSVGFHLGLEMVDTEPDSKA